MKRYIFKNIKNLFSPTKDQVNVALGSFKFFPSSPQPFTQALAWFMIDITGLWDQFIIYFLKPAVRFIHNPGCLSYWARCH